MVRLFKNNGLLVEKDGKYYGLSRAVSVLPHPTLKDHIILSNTIKKDENDVVINVTKVDNVTFQDRNALIKIIQNEFLKPEGDNQMFTGFVENNGSRDMAQDFSAAETNFEFDIGVVFGNLKVTITALNLYLRDNGSLDTGEYGNNIDLSNGAGIDIKYFKYNPVSEGLEPISLFAGEKVRFNPDYERHGWQVDIHTFGSGAQSLQAQVLFKQIFGRGLVLDGALGEKVQVTLNDNLSNLQEHTLKVAGYFNNLFY